MIFMVSFRRREDIFKKKQQARMPEHLRIQIIMKSLLASDHYFSF